MTFLQRNLFYSQIVSHCTVFIIKESARPTMFHFFSFSFSVAVKMKNPQSLMMYALQSRGIASVVDLLLRFVRTQLAHSIAFIMSITYLELKV
jgi:hypothetical protein